MSVTTSKGGRHRRGSNGGASSSRGSAKPPKQARRRGFFRRFWWVFVLVPVLIVLGVAGVIAYAYAKTDVPEPPVGPQTTKLYDIHHHLITALPAAVNRTVIDSKDIPDVMKHAVVAIEDKGFYKEGGVSPFSIVRAAWADVTHGSVVQGGSTITQQYVKNVYTGNERTFARKIKEAIIAVKLAHQYSKDEILTKYLNTIYFGNGAYGVQAAASTYWGIPARRLDTLEAATLAGLVSSPVAYDPVRHPDQAKVRRDIVLGDMAQQGYITQAQAAQLKAEPVKVNKPKPRDTPHAYFVQYVNGILQDRYGEAETFQGGLRVVTSLDLGMQNDAEHAVAAHLTSPKDPSAALVAIDPATGQVRAMVGGRDFNKVKLNLATQAHRSSGSAFKPFTLATAMKQHIDPHSTWYGPPQITIPDKKCYTGGKPWMPSNSADESAGTMSLLDATAHSVNTIFAQLVVAVGPDNVVQTAHDMGIESKLNPVCSITLGTQDVTPLEMADAYATLAARGVHRQPQPLSQVKSSTGQVLDTPSTHGIRALQSNDADLVTYALQGVITHGTGTSANIGRPAAGKTGTAENFIDAWFCGYTPQLAACVWVGYSKGEISMTNVEGVSEVFGGTIPAAIWHDFMSAALAKVPATPFPTPSFAGYDVRPKGAASPTPSPSPSPSPSPTPSPSPSSIPPTTPPSPSPSPSPSPTASQPSPQPSGGGSPSP